MENPFELVQVIDAPIKRVWEALTDEKQMKVWYFPQLHKFRPVIGYKFEFHDDGSSYKKEWRVTHIEQGRRLSHSWVYVGYPGYSEVTFEIDEASAGRTKLILTHTGLSTYPEEPHFARQRFEAGWKGIIGNLKMYLEK